MNYKSFIETFAEYLILFGEADEDSIKGASLKEINKLESNLNIKLPEIYKQFLIKMGKKAGRYGRGEYMFINSLEQIQTNANNLLEDDKSELFPLTNNFTFFMHEDYDFLFFPLNQGDNPPIYRYLDKNIYNDEIKTNFSYREKQYGLIRTQKFNKICYSENGGKQFDSFSDFLLNQLDRMLTRNKEEEYEEEYNEMIESFKLSNT